MLSRQNVRLDAVSNVSGDQASAWTRGPGFLPSSAQFVPNRRLSGNERPRYDAGMTKSKIAISLPKDQIARVNREVRAGRAGSVSGYIAKVLAEQERRESLRELLQDLIEQHGKPAARDIKWAERALKQPQG